MKKKFKKKIIKTNYHYSDTLECSFSFFFKTVFIVNIKLFSIFVDNRLSSSLAIFESPSE